MPQGRQAWYSANLGDGFIIPDDKGPKPFVRREGIQAGEEQTLENNDRVSYLRHPKRTEVASTDLFTPTSRRLTLPPLRA